MLDKPVYGLQAQANEAIVAIVSDPCLSREEMRAILQAVKERCEEELDRIAPRPFPKSLLHTPPEDHCTCEDPRPLCNYCKRKLRAVAV